MSVDTQKSTKQMTEAQAKELSRVLYGDYNHADEIRPLADEFVAHSTIVYYINKPMLCDEAVKEHVRKSLGMEE